MRAVDRMSENELLDLVQRQSIRFFREAAHPTSGLARNRIEEIAVMDPDLVAIGASGFGIMALIVAVERSWLPRRDAIEQLTAMLALLERAPCYHGVYPHLMNGRSGVTVPFSRKDDGGDLVETAFLIQGLLTARQYFSRDEVREQALRARIDDLWHAVEWDWYTRDHRNVLTWHWSPNNGWVLDHEIRGWNECLIVYILAASAPRHPIPPQIYHRGWAEARAFSNRRMWHGIELPLGPDFGGPLNFSHYSFLGLDPRGLRDTYADYWEQNVAHTRINHVHCVQNPHRHAGYGASVWGLSSCDGPDGYAAYAPDFDRGVIAPAAAIASLPYAPELVLPSLRHILDVWGDRIWGEYGFVSGFQPGSGWSAKSWLGIDLGPLICMIENYRTGLLWSLFMSCPEIRSGLQRLGFETGNLRER